MRTVYLQRRSHSEGCKVSKVRRKSRKESVTLRLNKQSDVEDEDVLCTGGSARRKKRRQVHWWVSRSGEENWGLRTTAVTSNLEGKHVNIHIMSARLEVIEAGVLGALE
ncbi:unnamed protein product [Pleuronectes platessa]|uniref:Uncharacterized protein n=1 Tax=Pleuronectes platessa TaxID=8262 RepID=A0A9N7YNP7_PLEPL|nr:unnamed protein product [Pleuronectes platessa]